MDDRIEKHSVTNSDEIQAIIYDELKRISRRKQYDRQAPLMQCIRLAASAGTRTIIVQRRIQDPDFMAEYSAYYSKQFNEVDRRCSRIHFFTSEYADADPLAFLDQVETIHYLGFITLRPIISAPVGASILNQSVISPFIRCSDRFPVHLAGKKFDVKGTPFLQQDNAVGACAQASIWMSLRTLRKKEGDRAHDPAQITDAATKYNVIGRIKPNREGLTIGQMVEAIRAAGYSPHRFALNQSDTPMTELAVYEAIRQIHPYIESEIPVILILNKSGLWHAIVVIGHTWSNEPHGYTIIEYPIEHPGPILQFSHAVNWVPNLIIHNDNSGPYLTLPSTSESNEYSLACAVHAIPLLPIDVFMTAEEAFEVGMTVVKAVYRDIRDGRGVSDAELVASSEAVAFRLLLVEKRKLREWAATCDVPQELQAKIRLMDLPKRIWIFELHLKSVYGAHGEGSTKSLVGFILIDPTGDESSQSSLMMYFNVNYPRFGLKAGVMSAWEDGIPKTAEQVTDTEPLKPMRS